jgi:tetratricopeptide (TPR) repeat protein
MSDQAGPAPSRSRIRLGAAVLGVVILAMLAAAWFWPAVLAWRERESAANELASGSIGAAQRKLARAASLRPSDWRVSLAQAACHRRLGEKEAWQAAVDRAAASGAEASALRLERELGALRFGEVAQVTRGKIDALVAEGAPPREALAAVVHALLAVGSSEARDEALQAIDQWQPGSGDGADVAYLRGVCLAAAGDRTAAQEAFQSALTSQPRHELARSALGRSLEEQYRLAEALPHAGEVFAAAPDRLAARLDLARLLRKLNRLADARRILQPLTTGAEVSPVVALEAGEIDYESGDYAAAAKWFEQADLEGSHVAESLRSAASNFAYQNDFGRSAQLFARIDDAQALVRQTSELKRRLQIDPNDASAAQELKRMSESPAASSIGPDPQSSASPLFVRHCGACHGADGGGTGTAARFLSPRPRNLRADKYRLVSSQNLVPSLADIELVIRQGIPGTSMPAFDKLPDADREQLAKETLQLYRTRFGNDEAPQPAEPIDVPAVGEASAESIARGQAIYGRAGCVQCHGADGLGAGAPPMFNDEGRQTAPRDLVHEPMKGGPSLESLHRRIRLGMPGTPHPAAASLPEPELIDLVQFCRFLAKEPSEVRTNYERSLRAAQGR